MSDLPETSSDDLRRMGITPELIADKIRAAGWSIDGDVKGFSLPGDGAWGNADVKRCRNVLRSDWKPVEQRQPYPINASKYDQEYDNFEGDQQTDFNFNNAVTITTGTDYAQTKSFDVSVNLGIPLGQSGAMAGFNANMSRSEIASRSESKSTQHAVSFLVSVPAHEGRLVSETTTEFKTDTVYEAKLAPRGSVGIEIDPGWWLPNHVIYFYHIEYVFPDAVATSRIVRGALDTTVDTKITILMPPNESDKGKYGELVEFRCHVPLGQFGEAQKDTQGRLSFHLLEQKKPPEPKDPETEQRMTYKLVFNESFPPVPVQNRLTDSASLRTKVFLSSTPRGAITTMGYYNFQPNGRDPDSAALIIGYDPKKTTKVNLQTQIGRFSSTIPWGGKYCIYFT